MALSTGQSKCQPVEWENGRGRGGEGDEGVSPQPLAPLLRLPEKCCRAQRS